MVVSNSCTCSSRMLDDVQLYFPSEFIIIEDEMLFFLNILLGCFSC